MRPEQLRELLRAQPFQPFRVHLSGGASYDVTHPEAANVAGGILTIVLPPSGILGPGVERHILISFIHITHLEVFFFGGPEIS
jgi:hypothetical protein